MFKRKKIIGKKNYNYLEKSFRIGRKVKKLSFYLGKENLRGFLTINENQINQLVEITLNHLYKKKNVSFYFEREMVKKIESYRIQFKVLWDFLDKDSQQEIINEFFTRFLVNNMLMEGSTITYNSADRINKTLKKSEKSKIIKLPNVSDEDIRLYIQLREAYKLLSKKSIRSAKNFADLHKIIYKNIYSFAGNFRKVEVTFGDPFTELANTLHYHKIRKGYNNTIHDYTTSRGKKYDFERIINFHISYQKVHGFRDGNSRLGRLIMTDQLLKHDYPPMIIKSPQSFRYRKSLVKAINHKYMRDFLKLIYNEYKRTFEKFWLPRIEKKLKLNIK